MPDNPYRALYVSEDAPDEVVRAAYRALSLRWHPDRNPHDPTAVGRMMEINEAYRLLSDPMLRAAVDQSLREAEFRVSAREAAAAAAGEAMASPASRVREMDREAWHWAFDGSAARFWLVVAILLFYILVLVGKR